MPFDPAMIKAKKAILRLGVNGRVRYGLMQGGDIRLYEGSPFSGGKPGRKKISPDKANLLAPCRPSKVVAVGLNYKAHAKEMKLALPDEPMLFMKPSSSIIGPGDAIIRPQGATRVDHEAELGVVMAGRCAKVGPAQAPDYILGYTCLNDVTERDLQAKDVQYTRAKGFDTFCPIGPAIALDLDTKNLRVKAKLNRRIKQDSRTSDLIFSPAELVSFISRVMTLYPGDVIATGTPAGVGPMQDGDMVQIEIQGVGRLQNPVRDAK